MYYAKKQACRNRRPFRFGGDVDCHAAAVNLELQFTTGPE
jgi:hypothetical protein